MKQRTAVAAMVALMMVAAPAAAAHPALDGPGGAPVVLVTALPEGGFAPAADSSIRDISADGRYVLFQSNSTAFVPGDLNGSHDLFVRDTLTGSTVLATVASDGTQADRDCSSGRISGDGRFVVFACSATNLEPGEGNGNTQDVFRHDTISGETVRVSVTRSGGWPSADAWQPDISADGRYVTFQSYSPEFVAGDDNGTFDVFRRDVTSGTTTLVSAALDGSVADDTSRDASLSADGSRVVFVSSGTDLVSSPPGPPGDSEVYVRDIAAGTTELVTITPSGKFMDGSVVGGPIISADGHHVAFPVWTADGSQFVPHVEGFQIYVRHLDTAITEWATMGRHGDGGQGSTFNLDGISAHGERVSFESAWGAQATRGPLELDPRGLDWDCFVRDLPSQVSVRASIPPGAIEASGDVSGCFISDRGHTVGFDTKATEFLAGDHNHGADVFVRPLP
jgi:hypothetical protein